MHNKHWLFALITALYLSACSGGGGSSPAPPAVAGGASGGGSSSGDSGGSSSGDGSSDGGSTDGTDEQDACGVSAQIDFVESITDSWYLWYDEMATVDKADYDSAQAYLDARLQPLLDDGRDKGFSYMTTITQDETNISSGAYVGFGFRSTSTSNQLFITDVFESGPAFTAGVRRGMELIAVDRGWGFETLEDLRAQGASNAEIFGPSEVGVERGFRFVRNGEEIEVSVAKEEVSPPALAEAPKLIERAGTAPVGYLHLRQFIDAALDPAEGFSSLSEAATVFANNDVSDLVIDLRYNGGGLLRVADTMMDLLAGRTARGEPSFKIQVNDQHPDYNDDQGNWGFFDELSETFSPSRIAFITSRSTASASELIINGLDPHIDVVMVGGNTFGKQVGQGRWDMYEFVEGLSRADCDVALRLTAFEIVNGENQGGYHQVGLEGSGRFTLCEAEDDVLNAFGDPKEASLGAALDWLATGACPSTGSGSQLAPVANERRAGPAWLSAEYIPERIDGNLR
jgi:carboxyl-terminal processing protease